MTDFIRSTRETAAVLGCDMRTLQRHVHRGMPRVAPDRFDLREVVPWVFDWERQKRAGDKRAGEAVDNLLRAQTAKISVQIAQARGELVPYEDVRQRLGAIASTIASGLDSLAPRLAGDLADRHDATEIAAVLKRETDALLLSIRYAAGLPLHEPEAAED